MRTKRATNRFHGATAAVLVLREAEVPLGVKEIIRRMREKGYWSSAGGRNPETLILSMIIREIRDKGNQSRFVEAGRGLFAVCKGRS